MNKQEYDKQAIREYLLGTLPEAEAEQFDELSFTDDEFADALKSVERDLVDSYVNGELYGRALETFQSHYLASPLRCEKVNFAKTFQVVAERSLKKMSVDNSAVVESHPKHPAARFISAINILTASSSILRLGAAAAVLMLLILAGLWFFNNRFKQNDGERLAQEDAAERQQESRKTGEGILASSETAREVAATNKEVEAPQSESVREQIKKPPVIKQSNKPKQDLPPPKSPPKVSVATFILTPPLRSVSQIPKLTIPAETEEIAMQLQLESDDYATYRITLIDQSDKRLWSSGTLKKKSKGKNKTLNIQFPARLLKSEIFLLVVSGVKVSGGVEIISNYPFRAVIE